MRPSAAMVRTCTAALETYRHSPDMQDRVQPWVLLFARSVRADKTFATVEKVHDWFAEETAGAARPLEWALLGGRDGMVWAADAVENTPTEERETMAETIERLDREADHREALVAGGGLILASTSPEDWASPDLYETLGQRRPEFGGVAVVEGIETDDKRLIETGGLTHRPLPLSYRTQPAAIGGHDGAVAIGVHTAFQRTTIEQILAATGTQLREGAVPIWTQGVFDTGDEAMRRRQQIDDGMRTGVSVDLVDVKIRMPETAEEAERIMMGEATLRIQSAKIAGSTQVDIPAFEDARLQILGDIEVPGNDAEALVASGGWLPSGVTFQAVSPVTWFAPADEPTELKWHHIEHFPKGMRPSELDGEHEQHLTEIDSEPQVLADAVVEERDVIADLKAAALHPADETLVASGAPRPPKAWFEKSNYDRLEPVTISEPDENGLRQLDGHAAAWGSCHIGFQGRCVDVPRGLDYSSFQGDRVPGRVVCDDGTEYKAGPVVMDTVHPSLRAKASDASAHYAHTGCIAAQVRLYEDEHGLQVRGWVMPDLTEAHMARLQASDYSPDWRPRASADGGRGVVAVLAVPVSGFNLGLVASAGDGEDIEDVDEAALIGSTWTPHAAAHAARQVAALETLGADVPAELMALAVSTEPPELTARKHAALAALGVVDSCECGGSCCSA